MSGYDGHDFSAFAADYRQKVAIANQRLRTIGLPPDALREQDARTEIPLRSVFVPQTFHPEEDLERSVSLADLLRRRSCVVLGDPGMGKTTAFPLSPCYSAARPTCRNSPATGHCSAADSTA